MHLSRPAPRDPPAAPQPLVPLRRVAAFALLACLAALAGCSAPWFSDGGRPAESTGSGAEYPVPEPAPAPMSTTASSSDVGPAGSTPIAGDPASPEPAADTDAGAQAGGGEEYGDRALIVFDGDSLTYGVGADAGEDYPTMALRLLPDGISSVNVAVPGQEWSDLLRDAEWEIDPLCSVTVRHNILVVWAGTNDLNRTHTATRVWRELRTYCHTRRQKGWKVVVLTVLPRIPTRSGSRFERQRRRLNHSIREGWPAIADALADVAHDKRIGDHAGFSAAQYKSDGVHNNAAGNRVIADVVAEAVRSLLRRGE